MNEKVIEYAFVLDSYKSGGLFYPPDIGDGKPHLETHRQILADPKITDAEDIVDIHIRNAGTLPVSHVSATIVTDSDEKILPPSTVTMYPTLDREVAAENQYMVVRLRNPLAAGATVDMEVRFKSIKSRKETVSDFSLQSANVESEVGVATKTKHDDPWRWNLLK